MSVKIKIQDQQVIVFYAEKQVIYYNESIEVVKKRIESELKENENDIRLMSIYSQILHQYENDYQTALKYLKKILQLKKSDIDARLELAIIMMQYLLGNVQECQDILNECLRIDNDYWRTYMIQIKYYDFLLKGNSFMMKEIKYLLNKFPNNPWITVYYWQIAGDENELKIGEQDINFIENCKYLDFEMLRRIAYYLQRVDENELAEQIQIQSLKLNPKSFVNLNNYAQLLRDSYNRYEECIQYCEKSLEQNPRYSVAWLNLSFAYQQQQNYEKSIVNIKKVLELQKNMPIFYEGLIQNYCNLEQSDMVFYYCQKADKKFPNDQSINMIYTQELVQNLIEFEFYENQNDKDLELSQIIQYKNLNMIYKDETYINDYNQMSNSFNHLFDLFDDLYDFIEMV